jgi:hypothetical protein
MKPWRVCRLAVADSHYSDEKQDPDPDPQLSKNSEPNLHQRETRIGSGWVPRYKCVYLRYPNTYECYMFILFISPIIRRVQVPVPYCIYEPQLYIGLRFLKE